MRPEGEAETSQPTPEEETDRTDSEEHKTGIMGNSLGVVGDTTQKDSTQRCPAQPAKGWSKEGLHAGKTGAAVGSESGSPSMISSSSPSRQVAILLQLKRYIH